MNLLHNRRTLIHSGYLLRQSGTWSGWRELWFLFDNYCTPNLFSTCLSDLSIVIITRPKQQEDGVIKYYVSRRVCVNCPLVALR